MLRLEKSVINCCSNYPFNAHTLSYHKNTFSLCLFLQVVSEPSVVRTFVAVLCSDTGSDSNRVNFAYFLIFIVRFFCDHS